eukprot:scaffold13617_cov84-Skeletonema_marinoi.AAC.8
MQHKKAHKLRHFFSIVVICTYLELGLRYFYMRHCNEASTIGCMHFIRGYFHRSCCRGVVQGEVVCIKEWRFDSQSYLVVHGLSSVLVDGCLLTDRVGDEQR